MLHSNISHASLQYLPWGTGDIPLPYRRRFLRGAAMFDNRFGSCEQRTENSKVFHFILQMCFIFYIIYILYIIYNLFFTYLFHLFHFSYCSLFSVLTVFPCIVLTPFEPWFVAVLLITVYCTDSVDLSLWSGCLLSCFCCPFSQVCGLCTGNVDLFKTNNIDQ